MWCVGFAMTARSLLSIRRRTGTPAAAMEDQVPIEVTQPRFDRLLKEVQEIAEGALQPRSGPCDEGSGRGHG